MENAETVHFGNLSDLNAEKIFILIVRLPQKP